MLTFYYNPLTCSLGVQIALLETGIPHDRVMVNLMGDRSGYQKINPSGTVPALDTEAGVLTESTAILAWLALTYPQARLLPEEAYGFAHGLSLLAWLSSTVHIARRQTKFPARFTTDAAGYVNVQQAGAPQFMSHLQRIDQMLARQRFMMGDLPNACDYQLMAYANWCAIDGIPTGSLPNFELWRQRMLERPAIQQALLTIDSPLVT